MSPFMGLGGCGYGFVGHLLWDELSLDMGEAYVPCPQTITGHYLWDDLSDPTLNPGENYGKRGKMHFVHLDGYVYGMKAAP